MQWVWKYHHHYHRCRRQRNFMRWKISSRLPFWRRPSKKKELLFLLLLGKSALTAAAAIWHLIISGYGAFHVVFCCHIFVKSLFLPNQSHDLFIYSNKLKLEEVKHLWLAYSTQNFYSSLQLNQHQSHQVGACKTLIQCLTCLRRPPRQPQELWRQLRSQPLQQTI